LSSTMTDCGPELSVATGAAVAVGPVVTASTVVTAAAMTQEDRKERRMCCALPISRHWYISVNSPRRKGFHPLCNGVTIRHSVPHPQDSRWRNMVHKSGIQQKRPNNAKQPELGGE
jgi:hypothetical protein